MRSKPCLLATAVFLGLVAVIMIISMVTASFDNVDEGQACMQYSNYTGILEDGVITTPENSFVGLHSGFACYPTLIQDIEFTHGGAGVNRVLGTRTKEGLFISLQIHIEYRVDAADMKNLLLQFGRWHHVVSNLTIIARSTLRNTASRYGGLDYLAGDRGSIAASMKADLHLDFQQFSTSVNEVNIKSISLSPEFERAFEAVREVKLQASKALQTREVDLTQEQRANESAVITLLAQRESTLLAARAAVTTATLERDALTTTKQTEIITTKLKAASTRATALTQARSEVNKAKSERTARLTEAQVRESERRLQAQRSRGVVLIEAKAEVEKAKAALVAARTSAETSFASLRVQLEQDRDSKLTAARAELAAAVLERVERLLVANTQLTVTGTREQARKQQAVGSATATRTRANATAAALQQSEAARIDGAAGLKSARVNFLAQLRAKTGMSATQVLRYLRLGALGRSSTNTTMFVDYTKVPLTLEASAQAGSSVTVGAGIDTGVGS